MRQFEGLAEVIIALAIIYFGQQLLAQGKSRLLR